MISEVQRLIEMFKLVLVMSINNYGNGNGNDNDNVSNKLMTNECISKDKIECRSIYFSEFDIVVRVGVGVVVVYNNI